MKNNNEYRSGLMEVYRASFKGFTLAAAQMRNISPADQIAHEMARAELEQAREAYSRSRDALVRALFAQYAPKLKPEERSNAAVCCA